MGTRDLDAACRGFDPGILALERAANPDDRCADAGKENRDPRLVAVDRGGGSRVVCSARQTNAQAQAQAAAMIIRNTLDWLWERPWIAGAIGFTVGAAQYAIPPKKSKRKRKRKLPKRRRNQGYGFDFDGRRI